MLESRNLSNSSLKVLDIFLKLLNSDCSKSELIDNFSEDSLAIYLATLKNAGINISKRKKNNNYYISENINLINFNKQDLKILAKIKKTECNRTTINNIINFNNLLFKFANITDKYTSEKLLEIVNSLPFGMNLHSKILFLGNCINTKTNIKLIYNSPRKGKEEYKLSPMFLKVNNSKLYLWANDYSSSLIKCFKVDRIISAEEIDKNVSEREFEKFVICEVNSSFDMNKLNKEKIEILNQEEEIMRIKLFYFSSFELFQKILSLGDECKIIEPIDFQNKLIEKLKSIRSLYA